MDPFITLSYTIEEVVDYIKNMHFPIGKETIYLSFVQTPSFPKHVALLINQIEKETLKHLNILLDNFNIHCYNHEQIAKISINLFSLTKFDNIAISSKAERLIELIKQFEDQ